MYLVEKSSETATVATQYLSKLRNMKLHLTELINKRVRIDLEIRMLKKTLATRQKDYEGNLKLRLQLNSLPLTPEQYQILLIEDPGICNTLSDLDKVEKELLELLSEEETTRN